VKIATLEHVTSDVGLLASLVVASPGMARALLSQALPLCADRLLEVRRGPCVCVCVCVCVYNMCVCIHTHTHTHTHTGRARWECVGGVAARTRLAH
jgi:hypothetical protein